MKEEAESHRKLPPKLLGGVGASIFTTTQAAQSTQTTQTTKTAQTTTTTSTSSVPVTSSTPAKVQNDEILSSLLRMNNFDSISSIKDESLDIDLSACVTITADPSSIIGNSLSSSDFWRVLDENAQVMQLDSSGASCSSSGKDFSRNSMSPSAVALASDNKSDLKEVLKKQQTDFSGTFLRPEVPSHPTGYSPLKRTAKTLPVEQIAKLNIQQIRDIPTTKTSMTLEGIPWLAPIRIQSSPILVTDTTAAIKKHAAGGGGDDDDDNIISSSAINIKIETTPIDNNPDQSGKNLTAENNKTVDEKPIAELHYKCVDCSGKIIRDSKELTAHINHYLHYKCSECNKEYDLETSLKKHLKTHRNLEARKDAWKKCPDCGKCLKHGSMWMHRKIHADNKKHVCDICGQKFVQKINLTHHSRIHSAEKPFECGECKKRFQERSHLQRHQEYHAQIRSYRCDKCGKMYKTERCLKVHNLVHLEHRPFACTVCGKSFISNSKLKQHSNIHTGERPFKCNYCPRDFTNFPNWLKHTRRRHKVDHKTGEMLENIPSYCSKKATLKNKKPPDIANTEHKDQVTATSTVPQKINGTNGKDNNKTKMKNTQVATSIATSVTTTTTATTTTAVTTYNSTTTSTEMKPTITGSNASVLLTNCPKQSTQATNVLNSKSKRKRKLPPTTNEVVKQTAEALTDKNLAIQDGQTSSNLKFTDIKTGVKSQVSLKMPSTGGNAITNTNSNSTTTFATPMKAEKVKRERKQSTPKQIQKPPPRLEIKKEFIEADTIEASVNIAAVNPKLKQEPLQKQLQEEPQQRHQRQHHPQHQSHQAKGNFADLHCLSINSAEELIMEQALEMEECGIFKATSTAVPTTVLPSFVATDNAISSETMANICFKIKQEDDDDLNLKNEEHNSIKNTICTSVESSPFSSPASLELNTNSTTLNSHLSEFRNNFYLSTFTLDNSNSTINNIPSKMENISSVNHDNHIIYQLPQLVAANFIVPNVVQINSSNTGNSNTETISMPKQTFFNQLYLPIAVNATPTLILKNNQTLPSVDTLLFSHSPMNVFTGCPAQTKLPANSTKVCIQKQPTDR